MLVRAEATLPQSVTDDDDAFGARLVFFRRESPPELWLDTEQREQTRRRAHSAKVFGFTGAGDVERLRVERSDLLEDLTLVPPIDEVTSRDRKFSRANLSLKQGPAAPDDGQPL